MQKPPPVRRPAKDPETVPQLGCDDVVIALHVLAAPPAGLDTLRSPRAGDDVIFVAPRKPQRRPVRNHGDNLNGDRLLQPQRPGAFRQSSRLAPRDDVRSRSERTTLNPRLEAARILRLRVRDQDGPRHRVAAQPAAQTIDQTSQLLLPLSIPGLEEF